MAEEEHLFQCISRELCLMNKEKNKYFIKCDTCNFLTEIVNENQIYCYNCTTMFPNYYKKWKQENHSKKIEDYKVEVGIPYSDLDIKLIVSKSNKKHEITMPSKEQIKRRSYIAAGIPLDRGGYFEWDLKQLFQFILIIALIFGLLFLITYLT